MQAASHAIRQAVEKAESTARTAVSSVWIGCAGAGLSSKVASVEIAIGGRRIEEDDIEQLLIAARDHIQPEGRMVLHAQPAHYTLDGAHGIADPKGLHAETLGVDVHVVLAEGPPVRNLIEAVQNAHLEVEAVVASPLASAFACLTAEERELGVALVEIGAQVTHVSVHAGGMLLGLKSIPVGSNDITDAIASNFGIRRSQAERLKCVSGSAIATPERPPRDDPGQRARRGGRQHRWPAARDEHNRIARAELVAVVTERLSHFAARDRQGIEGAGLFGRKCGAGGADRRRRRIARYCRIHAGRARASGADRHARRNSRACPKPMPRPDSRRWRGCASTRSRTLSTSASIGDERQTIGKYGASQHGQARVSRDTGLFLMADYALHSGIDPLWKR